MGGPPIACGVDVLETVSVSRGTDSSWLVEASTAAGPAQFLVFADDRGLGPQERLAGEDAIDRGIGG